MIERTNSNKPSGSAGIEDLVTDEDRETPPTEFTSEACEAPPGKNVGVSPPNAEALCPDWEHLGG